MAAQLVAPKKTPSKAGKGKRNSADTPDSSTAPPSGPESPSSGPAVAMSLVKMLEEADVVVHVVGPATLPMAFLWNSASSSICLARRRLARCRRASKTAGERATSLLFALVSIMVLLKN